MGPVRGGGHRSKGGGTVQREKGPGDRGEALLGGGHRPKGPHKGTPGSMAGDAEPRRPERARNAWRPERGSIHLTARVNKGPLPDGRPNVVGWGGTKKPKFGA
ncbi:unnamed protein product [Calypogeia fissa]